MIKVTEEVEVKVANAEVAVVEAIISNTMGKRKFRGNSDQEVVVVASAGLVVEEAHLCSRNFKCGENRLHNNSINLKLSKTISRTIECVK